MSGVGEQGREKNGMRERKKETNSFLVTRLGCDSVIDRKKRKMTYAAMAPLSKEDLLYAQRLDWSSFESNALLEKSSLPCYSRWLESPLLVLGNRRILT